MDAFSCKNCSQSFHSADLPPMVLQCGHSICKNCCEGKEIKCLECCSLSQRENIKPNFCLVDVLRKREENSMMARPYTTCRSVTNVSHSDDSQKFCKTCDQFICCNCTDSHHIRDGCHLVNVEDVLLKWKKEVEEAISHSFLTVGTEVDLQFYSCVVSCFKEYLTTVNNVLRSTVNLDFQYKLLKSKVTPSSTTSDDCHKTFSMLDAISDAKVKLQMLLLHRKSFHENFKFFKIHILWELLVSSASGVHLYLVDETKNIRWEVTWRDSFIRIHAEEQCSPSAQDATLPISLLPPNWKDECGVWVEVLGDTYESLDVVYIDGKWKNQFVGSRDVQCQFLRNEDCVKFLFKYYNRDGTYHSTWRKFYFENRGEEPQSIVAGGKWLRAQEDGGSYDCRWWGFFINNRFNNF